MHKTATIIYNHLYTFISIALSSITFMDFIEFWIRVLSLITAGVMLIFAFRNQRRKRQQHEIEIKIKEQELFDIIESNKKKHG